MKNIILKNGFLGGIIVVLVMVFTTLLFKNAPENFDNSMVIGFAGMFLAYVFLFLGVKQYRDKVNNGELSFAKGLKIGLLIALIISTMYVVAWVIECNLVFPDFADKYAEHVIKNAKPEEVKQVTQSANEIKEIYKSQFMIFLFTYVEILPIGIVFALISALILKRKNK